MPDHRATHSNVDERFATLGQPERSSALTGSLFIEVPRGSGIPWKFACSEFSEVRLITFNTNITHLGDALLALESVWCKCYVAW
jgi:hypothetical protein